MDNNQLKCPVCGAQFKTQQELDSHSQKTHSNQVSEEQQEHSMTCSKCGLKAKSADELQKHSCET